MLKFDKVNRGSLRQASFEVRAGEVCQVSLSSEDRKQELMSVLLGLKPPEIGKVFLFGVDLYMAPEKIRLGLFRRVGVVPESGGLIGNLRIWENIYLPAWYHHDKAEQEAEEEIKEYFRRMKISAPDYKKLLGRLPDEVTVQQRIFCAVMRAWLMQPELLIYDFMYSGLNRDDIKRLIQLTRQYHQQHSKRVSVYLGPCDDAIVQSTDVDKRVSLCNP